MTKDSGGIIAQQRGANPALLSVRRWHLGFVVFLAGYYAFQNVWLHLAWFGVAVLVQGVVLRSNRVVRFRQLPRFLIAAGIFIGVMLLFSLRPGLPRSDLGWLGIPLAIGDAVLLLVFLDAAVRLGQRREAVAARAMLMLVRVAGVTAVISLLVFYWLPGHDFPTARLENVLVHFGLAPVLTGLMYGFAGLAAAVLSVQETQPRKRHYLLGWEALLLFAALCTHSRGAVLALIAGFGVLVVVGFNRAMWRPIVVLALVVMVYQWGLPLVTSQKASESDVPVNPVASLVARKDAGRLELYRIILKRMPSPVDHVLGRGRWANDVVKPPEMHWHAHHPHSVYLATFYRGGVVGVMLLGSVLFIGMLACWRVARAGQPMWLALACFGLAAFLFDGDDLTTLASMPRVEPLLLWFPLAAGVGAKLGLRGQEANSCDQIISANATNGGEFI